MSDFSKATYATASDGQVDAKGDLTQARADLAASRTALELQLGRNLLTVASHHLGHPERAADFFDQSLLEGPIRNHEDPAPPIPRG